MLRLLLTDYESATRWRWRLEDAGGEVLASHRVDLEPDSAEYRAFTDLPQHLRLYRATTPESELLARLGDWLGRRVLGAVASALAERIEPPATAVRVLIPAAATPLVSRPLELAHVGGRPLARVGGCLVYESTETQRPVAEKKVGEVLRVLAVFSQPDGTNPLALREERRRLERDLEVLAQTRSAAVEPRVLQYGATRAILRDALEEGAGWDVVHFSGHGTGGALVLEDETGWRDPIAAEELEDMLLPVRSSLKLLTLSACLSGAAESTAEARRRLDLDPPTRDAPPDAEARSASAAVLPSLGQRLAQQLDCAVLAMRYMVVDRFARELVLGLYDRLMRQGQPLPGALQLTLAELLGRQKTAPPISLVTPVLFGRRGGDLRLVPRRGPAPDYRLPAAGLLGFERQPEHFLGRVRPMMSANRALAPESKCRGVAFTGMPGVGKTHCALELAYRHEHGRFPGMAWWKVPDEEPPGAAVRSLAAFCQRLEDALPGLELGSAIQQPDSYRRLLLRLASVLSTESVLIVLDNVDGLLSEDGTWRDERWAQLLATLLGHDGISRLVLTTRRLPPDLQDHPALRAIALFPLSLQESLLVVRELPELSRLLDAPDGRPLLIRILEEAEGHPELLRLAEARLAQDPRSLERQLAETDGPSRGGYLEAGESTRSIDELLARLGVWTRTAIDELPATSRLVLEVLARLEEDDRSAAVLRATWPAIVAQLAATGLLASPDAPSPAFDPVEGVAPLLASALVRVAAPAPGGERRDTGDEGDRYVVHSTLAATVRRMASPAALEVVDRVLGDHWQGVVRDGLADPRRTTSHAIAEAALRAAPYLLRTHRGADAAQLLQKVSARDESSATMKVVVPLLRQIADATRDGPEALDTAALLARNLYRAGHLDEAEQRLREVMARRPATAREHHQASATAGDLANLLRDRGRFREALEVLRQKEEHTRLAGLGPWTQAGDAVRRLRCLQLLGEHASVLAEAEDLLRRLATLADGSSTAEAPNPWNVRESLWNLAADAARKLGLPEAALAFLDQISHSHAARGAHPLQVADHTFNTHAPLLALHRLDEARAAVVACLRTYHEHGEENAQKLGKMYLALACIEKETGRKEEAVRFQRLALAYSYRAGDAVDCAKGHHNLGTFTWLLHADLEEATAQRLAAACLRLRLDSGELSATLRNLAFLPLTELPGFAELAARVEAVEGVRFRDLLAALPPCGDTSSADGAEAALAEVWRRALAEKASWVSERLASEELSARADELLASAERTASEGRLDHAIEHLADSLAHAYQAADGERCAAGHHALAQCLERSCTSSETVMAHLLAAAILAHEADSTLIAEIVPYLAAGEVAIPPGFAELADRVEAHQEVRLRRLFPQIQRWSDGGDSAVRAVWRRVQSHRSTAAEPA